ncbi:MAG: DUF4013 domain-containing protein [Cyanobacteria bacterium REEB67]|nr:DUF4013 domain-containing protein [Cyanobacteria bacterium REEB67]
MTSTTLDLNDACKGIFKDREWPFKIMVGAFINCAAIGLFKVNPIFLPLCFAMWGLTCGYSLRVLRATIKGDLEKLPDWGDPIDLLVSGLSWLSIYLGFSFFILSILAMSLLVAGATSLISMNNPAFLPWAQGTFALVYILFVFFTFFLSILMANFAEEERMLAGFAWFKVLKRIARQPRPLLTAWLCGTTITGIAVIVPAISVIGMVLVPFLGFLSNVLALRLIGCSWKTAEQI